MAFSVIPGGKGQQGSQGGVSSAAAAAMGWNTVSAGYSEANFYTASKSNGDSAMLSLKMPEHTMQMLLEMVHSRDYPHYKNTHDVMRDALRHRFEWLTANSQTPQVREKMRDMLTQWDLEQHTASIEAKMQFCKDMIARNDQLFRDCQTHSLWEVLLDHLNSVREKTAGWEGGFQVDIKRICDQYEASVPEEALREWRRSHLKLS